MRLLLDTHIFLWFITGDSHLPIPFFEAIIESENEVFLSAASVWEIIIKYDLGRLPLPDLPGTYIPTQRERHRIETLPITESSLKCLSSLSKLHSDPFDSLLDQSGFV